MAKMIDPNALIEEIRLMKKRDPWRKLRGLVERWVRNSGYDILMLMVKHFPAVDAEEVVRCKDCKSYEQLGETEHSFVCVNAHGLPLAKSDSYCSRGERRTDGE